VLSYLDYHNAILADHPAMTVNNIGTRVAHSNMGAAQPQTT